MRVTYDKNVNAAYIYIVDNIEPGGVENTYPCDPNDVNGMINLDFDKEGKLIGIEVLGADKKLSKELLDKAEIIGK